MAVTSKDGGQPHERGAAIERAGEQGLLFGDDLTAHPENVGYRGPTACAAAGITYRQLDYWARTALVEPSVRAAHGSGSQRLYSFRDILVLKVVKRLLDTGISLQQIRAAVDHLRDRGTSDLARLTLMSDGVSVYECTSADEVVDLLAGGQGVFGIALGRIWQEVDGTLAELPAEAGRAARGTAGRRRRRRRPRRAGPAPRQANGLTAARLADRPCGKVRRVSCGHQRAGHPEVLRGSARGRRGDVRGRPRRVLRHPRPERGGQDHHPGDHRRACASRTAAR